MELSELTVRLVARHEEDYYQEQMERHHYLGVLPKIGETLWYVATYRAEWVALLSFSAAAWKCGERDRWIGWDFRHQYGRLNLLANNSRFLILPERHHPNPGSRTLSLCTRRIEGDWTAKFGHPLLLLETFVDPTRFQGTVYRAANWACLGLTRGFRRIRQGYSDQSHTPKLIFVRPLRADAQTRLSQPILEPHYCSGGRKLMLSANQMRSLPSFFADIPDPRRAQGRRHHLPVVLGIAAGAVLCGMEGCKAIFDWADSLGQKARARFGCRRENGRYVVPSESIFRDVLVRVDPAALDSALQRWNEVWGEEDQSLAIDGKTMCNAIDEEGRQTHVMSVVGHQTHTCYTQKKSAVYR